jgi:hypothetical protein
MVRLIGLLMLLWLLAALVGGCFKVTEDEQGNTKIRPGTVEIYRE